MKNTYYPLSIFLLLITSTLLLCGCNKEQEVPLRTFADDTYWVYDSPCQDQLCPNDIDNYYSFDVTTSNNGRIFGKFEVIVTCSNNDVLTFEFEKRPTEAGIYQTSSQNSVLDSDHFGLSLKSSNGRNYAPTFSDKIYVNVEPRGKISISFCTLSLSSTSGPYEYIHDGYFAF